MLDRRWVVRSIAGAAAAVVAMGLVGLSPALAQQGAQVPLTGAIVKSFVASYPTVKAKTDSLAQKYNVKADRSSVANSWGAWMTATAAWAELDGTVKPLGFTNFQSWLMTTISVATAYAYAKAGPQMDSGMAQAIEQIRNNPSIPDAQKKTMIDQLQGSAGAFAASKPPQANLDAVTPYLAELAVVFK